MKRSRTRQTATKEPGLPVSTTLRRSAIALSLAVLPVFLYAANQTFIYQGAVQSVSVTLTNPYSQAQITLNGNYNVNTGTYNGQGSGNTLLMTNASDLLQLAPAGVAVLSDIQRIVTGNGDDVVNLASTSFTLPGILIFGGTGNVIIWANSGDDTINAGTGNTVIDGGPGNDIINGGAGHDQLFGGDGDDTISGGGGNDILNGGTGNNQLDGGPGLDTAQYPFALSAATITQLGPDEFQIAIPGYCNDHLTNIEFAAFTDRTIALSTLAVSAWGMDTGGQLGDGTFNTTNLPVAVSSPLALLAVSGGGSHSLALKIDGTVQAWGDNSYGQLGNGTYAGSNAAVAVSGLTGVTAIAAGGSHSLALKNDGTVWTWGDNTYGQLGNGTFAGSNTAVAVSGLTGVTAIAAGGSHSLALKRDGTVWAWGKNTSGQLGNGTNTNSNIPVAVSGIGFANPTVNAVTAIAAGTSHSLAVVAGQVWAWGDNSFGQLGNGTFVTSPTPVPASGPAGVSEVAAGAHHSLAANGAGHAWAWGDNSFGQLGNGTFVTSATPVVLSGLTGEAALAAGAYHSLALNTDGTVLAWGDNESGQLGNGTFVTSATPVAVSGLSVYLAIAGGGSHSLALHAVPNSAPVATHVTVTGSAYTGQLLTGHYTYSDADEDPEGVSTFRWLQDGSAIPGATAITYTVTAADVGHSITFEVTPVATTGTSPGSAVTSTGLTILSNTTTTTVSSSLNPSVYGQAVSFTATISPSGATGTVQFLVDGVNFGPAVAVSGGAAISQITSSLTASGSPHTVTANFNGSGGYANSSGGLDGGQVVTAVSLTASVTANSKGYDGTNSATIATCSLTGVLAGDAGNVSCTAGGATFSDRNVGTGKTVTATGIALSGSSAGNYSLSSTTASTTANITTRAITVTAAADSKIYDGGTSSAKTPIVTSGSLASNDTASFMESFDSKSVGSRTMIPSGSVADGNSGNNYTVTFANGSGSIATKSVTVSGITTNDKTWDGTTTATLNLGGGVLNGVVPADGSNVSLGAAYTANFVSSNAGTGIAVTVSGLGLTGLAASNYALTQPTGLTATIAAAPPVITPGTPVSSTYGDSSVISVTVTSPQGTPTGNVTLSFLLNATTYYLCADGAVQATSCMVPLVNGTASVTTTNLPSGSFTISGAYSGDSDFAMGAAVTVSVMMSQAATGTTLTVTPNPAIYGRPATLAVQVADTTPGSSKIPTGAVTFSFTQNLTAWNVCADGAVTTSACAGAQILQLDSTGKASVSNTSNLPVGAYTITAAYAGDANFGVSSVGQSMEVDKADTTTGVSASASTVPYGQPVTLTAVVSGKSPGTLNPPNGSADDTVQFAYSKDNGASWINIGASVQLTAGQAQFVTSALPAGTNIVQGTFSGDVSFNGSSATAGLTVTALAVTASVTATGKTYDGTNSATIATCSLTGVLAGDAGNVSCTAGSATFGDRNVGTGKTVTATGIALGGSAAANYSLSSTTATTSVDITTRAITVTAAVSQPAYYSEPLTLSNSVTSGTLVMGDSLGAASYLFSTASTGPFSSSAPATAGSYYVKASNLSNQNYAINFAASPFTISLAPATITYTGPVTESYNQCGLLVSALLTDARTGAGIPGATVTITIGAQSVTLTTGSNGIASGTIQLSQGVGTVSANASFPGLTGTYAASATNSSGNFTITQNSGIGSYSGKPIYTGLPFFWTTSSTSSTATLTLSATLQDTSTSCQGDVRTARVTFAVRNADGTYTPLSGSTTNLAVGLVDPADTTVGTASATIQYNIGNAKFASLELAVIVGGNYVRNQTVDDTEVGVAIPGAANEMIGVGMLDNNSLPDSSNGYLGNAPVTSATVPAGESLNNFYTSFVSNVTYTKSLSNAKGKVSVLIKTLNRSDGTVDTTPHTYSITSNSVSSFTEQTDPNTKILVVSFGAKCNIVEVTDPATPVTLDSGTQLQLILTPSGSSSQSAAVTVQKTGGGLWYSSAWSGTETVQKPLVSGSTIIVQ
jgi:alpha-tubulin suppressor-like RCC1 family protein